MAKREGYSSKSRYERSWEKDREKRIAKESTEKSLARAEPDIDNILPSINKPCEDVLEEKFVSRAELDIDIKFSSTKKPTEGLIEKEEEQTKKDESLMTPSANITKEESLKRDCNSLNSFFQLYNSHSSSQKSKKKKI